MTQHHEILIAGFGGQGILFAGKFLAYTGLMEQQQVSWLPSYGPEMRGGTANCSVILSQEQVGCPIVSQPSVLVAMNLPSFLKYQDTVKSGGMIFVDSTLIGEKVTRPDVSVFYVPATQMAKDAQVPTLANMIMIGKLIKETQCVQYSGIEKTLEKVVSAKRVALLKANQDALQLGYDYQ